MKLSDIVLIFILPVIALIAEYAVLIWLVLALVRGRR
jgi:hypothetical protein